MARALLASGLDEDAASVQHTLDSPLGPAAWKEWTNPVLADRFWRDQVARIRLRPSWPDSLFIPEGADSANYWMTPAPDDHRYETGWPPKDPTDQPSFGDIWNGVVFSYACMSWETPTKPEEADAGVAIRYSPKMRLGTVLFEPTVNLSGLAKGFIRPSVEGSVTISVTIRLEAWEVTRYAIDSIAYKDFPLMTLVNGSGEAEHEYRIPDDFGGSRTFATEFLVQRGVSYRFGVAARVSIASTLHTWRGEPLSFSGAGDLKTWCAVDMAVPYMTVTPHHVYIK